VRNEFFLVIDVVTGPLGKDFLTREVVQEGSVYFQISEQTWSRVYFDIEDHAFESS
jgi:hypothetical protein